MLGTFNSLKKEDMLVVMGTSGNVIDIGAVARRVRCHTLLSNIETDKGIDGKVPRICDDDFDTVIHGRANDMVIQIDRIIAGMMTLKGC